MAHAPYLWQLAWEWLSLASTPEQLQSPRGFHLLLLWPGGVAVNAKIITGVLVAAPGANASAREPRLALAMVLAPSASSRLGLTAHWSRFELAISALTITILSAAPRMWNTANLAAGLQNLPFWGAPTARFWHQWCPGCVSSVQPWGRSLAAPTVCGLPHPRRPQRMLISQPWLRKHLPTKSPLRSKQQKNCLTHEVQRLDSTNGRS